MLLKSDSLNGSDREWTEFHTAHHDDGLSTSVIQCGTDSKNNIVDIQAGKATWTRKLVFLWAHFVFTPLMLISAPKDG